MRGWVKELSTPVVRNVGKTEAVSAFLPGISVERSALRNPRSWAKEHSLWDKAVPTVREDKSRAHISTLNMYKFNIWGCWGNWLILQGYSLSSPSLLRSWEVQKTDWRKTDVPHTCRKGKKLDCGKYKPVSFTSFPGKVMEHSLLQPPLLKYPGMCRTLWGCSAERVRKDLPRANQAWPYCFL